jgi:hypothetical protein
VAALAARRAADDTADAMVVVLVVVFETAVEDPLAFLAWLSPMDWLLLLLLLLLLMLLVWVVLWVCPTEAFLWVRLLLPVPVGWWYRGFFLLDEKKS